jgi:regulator-associated protein of mTOR
MARPVGRRDLRPNLTRANSELPNGAARLRAQKAREEGRERDGKITRHGWAAQLENEEIMRNLSDNFFMYYQDTRHETAANLPTTWVPRSLETEWRMKDRLKTVSALLAVCLNVGVDPPDVIKTDPCARLECWVDPKPTEGTSQHPNNSNTLIGKNLQTQYENLSLRTRYKVVLDPTTDELKRYTTTLRKAAHSERLLFHYNGHGVPKPTQSGEVWCFNRNYTQYIPISLYDLQEWIGAPGLWVWDCSAAGGIIGGFLEAAQKHSLKQQETLQRESGRTQQPPLIRWEDCIHLAACRDNEVLPTNPQLPADIFTSCLTTPINMAVRFFMLQNPIPPTSDITLEQARKIPGKVSERRTPLGELNWIFTAITDTIAWNCLEKPLFKKLFRQDLMVAALFRNFLLAQRIMRKYHCHPQSHPRIPDTHDHPLWKSWDLAVELILAQLPKLLEQQAMLDALAEANAGSQSAQLPELQYTHSDFFADQLSAFEVYLTSSPSNPAALGYQKPPEQLPIVLQVLLSQVHRLRALVLLSKFLDLGPWAVNLALSIGIFPYVVKLLQSQALELKAPMVYIWARILAVDQTCQADLLKDQGYMYFTSILVSSTGIPQGNVAEHRAMCTFVIAMLCKDFRPGKAAALEGNPELIENCLLHLDDIENPLLRQFSLLCLSNLCRDHPQAKAAMYHHSAHSRIGDRSHDPVPEVRAACLHALTSYVATSEDAINAKESDIRREEEILVSVILTMGMDGSIVVRKELTVFYSEYVLRHPKKFIVAAWDQLLEELDKKVGKSVDPDDFVLMDGHNSLGGGGSLPTPTEKSSARAARNMLRETNTQTSRGTIYRAVWRNTLSLSTDPHPEVARNASIIVDYVFHALLTSPLGPHAESVLEDLGHMNNKDVPSTTSNEPVARTLRAREYRPETPPSPAPSTASKGGDYFGLSRTASVAAAMKSLIGWGPKTPAESSTPPSPTSRRGSVVGDKIDYRSRPLTPGDSTVLPAELPPDALDNIAGPPHQGPAMIPPTPRFKPRDTSEAPKLPLVSNFFDWSASYFREPQMRATESDEPGSKDYNERLWRRNRNDKIIACTQPMKEAAGSQRWDVQGGYFGIGAAPVKMVFHQFESHLVTSDDRDSIAVWDWEKAEQLTRFSNANPPGSRVTDMRFINEDDIAMLMTGSSDGVIKIYRHYDDPKNIELVSSFRALSELLPSDKQSAGLVFDWQQGQGKVLVAGDDRVIRVWQAGQELCVTDIPARSSSCITSLTSDQVEGHVFVAGFGNGGVRVYDQRLRAHDSMIMDWTDRRADHHRSWIVGVHLQRGGLRELISAESNGGIRLWDIRMRRAVHSHNPPPSTAGGNLSTARSLRTLSVHEHAPVLALGGKDHTIRVLNTSTLKQISSFEPSSPYMNYLRLDTRPRIAPITATAFHPHRMMLACGAVNDGHVNLFKLDAPEIEGDSEAVRLAAAARAAGGLGGINSGLGAFGEEGGRSSVVEEW